MHISKFYFIFILNLAFHLTGFAQINTKIYFDADWKPTIQTKAVYYRLIIPSVEVGLYSVKDYFISGKVQFETKSSNMEEPFIKQGYTAWYAESGDTNAYSFYNNDVLDGPLIRFYPNGKRHSVQHFKEGKKEGFFCQYYPTGKLKEEFTMKDDVIDGPYKNYSLSGNLMKELIFKQGKEVGSYSSYNEAGILLERGDFDEPRRNGNFESYYANGYPRLKYGIKDAYLNGLLFELSQNGDTLVKGQFDKHFAQTFYHKYNLLGSEFVKKMKRAGQRENWEVYRDGKLVLKGYYVDDHRTGFNTTWTTYTYDGTQKLITTTFKGKDCQPDFVSQYKAVLAIDDLKNLFSSSWYFKISQNQCEEINTYHITQDENALDTLHPFKRDIRPEDKNQFSIADFLNNTTKIEKDPNVEGGYIGTFIPVAKDSIVYTDPSARDSFLTKNKCRVYEDKGISVTYCERSFGEFKMIFYASQSKGKLVQIRNGIKPGDNEVYFFYEQFESKTYPKGTRMHERWMGWAMSESFKMALENKVIDDSDIISFLENKIFFTSDFSGGSARWALEKYLNEE
jgi:uncharacterized protein